MQKRERQARAAAIERFYAKTKQLDNGCIEFTGHKKQGYGCFWTGEKFVRAHRFAWEALGRPLPVPPLQFDHLCRNRACVNICHLEVVSVAVNQHRGNGFSGVNYRKTACVNGHRLSGVNLSRYRDERVCKKCKADRMREAYAKNPKKALTRWAKYYAANAEAINRRKRERRAQKANGGPL